MGTLFSYVSLLEHSERREYSLSEKLDEMVEELEEKDESIKLVEEKEVENSLQISDLQDKFEIKNLLIQKLMQKEQDLNATVVEMHAELISERELYNDIMSELNRVQSELNSARFENIHHISERTKQKLHADLFQCHMKKLQTNKNQFQIV